MIPRLLFIVPAAMMILAIAPLPYGYYQLLRLVTFLAAAIIAVGFWSRDREGWSIAFGVLALLFNPIVRVSLEREVWLIVNVVAAAVFLLGLRAAKRSATWGISIAADPTPCGPGPVSHGRVNQLVEKRSSVAHTVSNLLAMIGITLALLSLIYVHEDELGTAAIMVSVGLGMIALSFAMGDPA